MPLNHDLLRQTILKDRKKLGNKSEINKQICEKLFSLDFINNSKTFFCYVSTKYEIDTLNIIEKLIKDNKTVCGPKVKADIYEMDAMKIAGLHDLKLGAYQILEPIGHEILNKNDIDIVIVPAVCFDLAGYRIGYGKGYYDRYLADFNGMKIGLCFEQFILENLDPKGHDIPVDIVITQDRLIYCDKN